MYTAASGIPAARGRRAVRLVACALLLAAAPALVAEDIPDETNPRVPGQPLPIVFSPWYCSECVASKLVEAEPRPVELMDREASKLADELDLKSGWIVIESPNFKVFSTLDGAKSLDRDSTFTAADLQRLKEIFPPFKPGAAGSYLNRHQRAHLYQIRLERLLSHFRALAGNDDPFLGMGGRFQVYLFDETDHYAAFSKVALGREFDPRVPVQRKYLPGETNYYVFATAAEPLKGKDQALNNLVAHHVGHLLINGHRGFVTDVWAWLEAGTAHYYERRESDSSNYFCLQGVEPPRTFVRGSWEKTIRLMVYRNKETSFGTWCEKLHTQELTGEEHALAWSYVEWLARTDPIRLGKLMDLSAVKGTTAADAVQKVFAITPYELHNRWRAYVLENYK